MKYLVSCLLILLCVSCSSSDNDSDTPQKNTSASVSVVSVSNILGNSATIIVNVTDDGGANVMAKGVCWSTSNNPTINDDKTSNGIGVGLFSSGLIGLLPSTLYYVRAYATNSEGTAYSEQQTLTTLDLTCGGSYQGNVTLRTQQQLDEFASNGYEEILGNITISDLNQTTNPIVDLTLLSCLTYIEGDFVISDNSQLESLFGLKNINIIGGNFLIKNNPNLDDISRLQGVNSIFGSLIIENNDELFWLSGLQNLFEIGGDFELKDNETLSTMGNLDRVGSIGGDIYIANNPNLPTISGLFGLDSLDGNFTVISNDLLENVGGLYNVVTAHGDIYISGSSIEHISDLQNLTSLEGNLHIEETAISYLSGLNDLINVGGDLIIQSNNVLFDFCGLTDLIVNGTIGGNYNVNNNGYNPTQQDIIDGNCTD